MVTNKVNKTSEKLAAAPSVRQIDPKETTESLEALLIEIANPPLNRRRESLANAIELIQEETRPVKTNIDYLVEISEALNQLLDQKQETDSE